jgi:hypothetical protein
MIILVGRMKKGTSGLCHIRHANSYKEGRKEDHFSYFETLEQKLLQESDKITNLIGKPSGPSDTRSLKAASTAPRLLRSAHSNNELDDSLEDSPER